MNWDWEWVLAFSAVVSSYWLGRWEQSHRYRREQERRDRRKHNTSAQEWRSAAVLWDEGFTAACQEHMAQDRDPSHPLRRDNPYLPHGQASAPNP